MSTYLFTKIEGETAEETTRRWIAYENERHAKSIEQGCSVCGEQNLDEYACFNCKAERECTNCCGCEDWCDVCEVHEVHLSDIECLAYEQEREGK